MYAFLMVGICCVLALSACKRKGVEKKATPTPAPTRTPAGTRYTGPVDAEKYLPVTERLRRRQDRMEQVLSKYTPAPTPDTH